MYVCMYAYIRMYRGEGATPNMRPDRTLGPTLNPKPNLQAVGHNHRMEPEALDPKIPASGRGLGFRV